MPLPDAVAARRIHHQWSPDEVVAERGFPDDKVRALEGMGHKVVVRPPATSANSILVTRGGFIGAADPRTRGALAAGY
jgi:gamma-glutamyltranspeptidase/glutathione hydrolase